MKKRAIKLLALTLVAIMTFFAVGCDMDAIFAPLSEIQPRLHDGGHALARLFPLALYGFYSCYRNALLGELAEGADRGIKRNVLTF